MPKALLLALLSVATLAAAPDAPALYKEHCAGCHESGAARIPNREALKSMSPDGVVRALTTGAMRFQGWALASDERAALAVFLTGKAIEAPVIAGRCSTDPPKTFAGPRWSGWGVDIENTRFQPAADAGLTAANLPKLKLKWAFGFPGDFVAYAQPTVAGGRVFIGSAGGKVYSLDSATGCSYWIFDAGAGVRSAITIGPGDIAYFGDLEAYVYALDAASGNLIWRQRVDDHPAARVTGAPKLHDGRLYVPLSSHEEWASSDPTYQCCKFRGSVVALDAKTGKQIWKTYTIAEAAHPTTKNKLGSQRWGPSGGGVWMSPTIDRQRRTLYIGTGDGYSEPPVPTTDSILAMDLATGKILWARQLTAGDAFTTDCVSQGPNCPDKPGPDFDFGSSPVLRTLTGGKRAIVVGQKSGVVHALDPDHDGAILWQTRIGSGGVLGGIQWGLASEGDVAYAALSDLALQITDLSKLASGGGFQPDPKAGGGLFAIQISTGEKLWTTPSPGVGCTRPGCSPSQSAAVTAIPGVVFSGGVDGHMRAYSSKSGRIIWDYDSVRDYDTVNKVAAKGGSIDGPGVAVAGGMVFFNSGYGLFNAIPGNVLLAFGVE